MGNLQEKLTQDYDQIWQNFLEQDKFSESVISHQENRLPYYSIIDKYTARIPRPVVLELGCGTGIDINFVVKSNMDIRAYASDILIKSVKIGQRVSKVFNNRIKFFVADTMNLPLKDGRVDMVVSQGLLEHFKDPLPVIKEQERILKDGGVLVINVPQKYTGYTLVKKMMMLQNRWELGWETEFSYKDLRKLGERLGLHEADVLGYQYWKSWREPAFVIKDLMDKIYRRLPLNRLKILAAIQNSYDSLWNKLELKWGHYFQQNIVIVFQKQISKKKNYQLEESAL